MSHERFTVNQLQAESQRLESRISEMETLIADARAEFQSIRTELKKRLRPAPEPRCSEHALLRFIERVHGLDVEAIRAEIMSPNIVAALKTGATGVTVRGVKFIAKDGVLVTVIAEKENA